MFCKAVDLHRFGVFIFYFLIDKFAEGFVHADVLASSLEKAWLNLHVQVGHAGTREYFSSLMCFKGPLSAPLPVSISWWLFLEPQSSTNVVFSDDLKYVFWIVPIPLQIIIKIENLWFFSFSRLNEQLNYAKVVN